MNISRNKKLFLLGVLIAIIIAIPLTLYVLQSQQDTRTKAQASTTLSFSPTSSSGSPIQKNANEEFSLNIQIDPGANLVSIAVLEITYDATKLEPSGTQAFVVNNAGLPVILQGPVYAPGKISVALSAGSDPTRALNAATSLGTVTFRALSNTATPTAVQFGSGTHVSSIAFEDSYSENVLSSSTPAYIQIGNLTTTCPPTPYYPPGPQTYIADLAGWQENPITNSQARGTANIVLSEDEDSAVVSLSFSNLSSSQTAAHIHGPGFPDENAGILFTLPNGSFTSHSISLSAQQVQWLKEGKLYINVHSSNYPNGEIRGLIHHSPSPSPTSTGCAQGSITVNHKNASGISIERGTIEYNVTTQHLAFSGGSGMSGSAEQGFYRISTYDLPNEEESYSYCTTSGCTPPSNFTTGNLVTYNMGANGHINIIFKHTSLAPSASPTPTITPTPLPTDRSISLTVNIHGLGQTGDNSNPSNGSSSNKNPLRQQRYIALEVFDIDQNLVYSANHLLNWGSLNYKGTIDVTQQLTAGSYYFKLKSEGTLRKSASGLIALNNGTITPLTFTLVNGDIDSDNSLTVLDYNVLFNCGYGDLDPLPMTDPGSTFNDPNCQTHITARHADLNDDGVIDRNDFNLFVREIAVQNGD